jgi:pre-mRNA-splicing factor 38B
VLQSHFKKTFQQSRWEVFRMFDPRRRHPRIAMEMMIDVLKFIVHIHLSRSTVKPGLGEAKQGWIKTTLLFTVLVNFPIVCVTLRPIIIMSRSALWRQEGNVKERERTADEIFETVVEEGRVRSRSRGVLPLWGPEDSFHFNPLLLRNTRQSPYFQKCCRNLSDWNAIIDEIYYEVKHLQPFSTDQSPSTAFCLLLRLLCLRMTDHQMDLTLKHADSPYIRGIGFLYLRYAGPPDQIWRWIEPYLYDDEELIVEAAGKRSNNNNRDSTKTVGEFVRHLFNSRDFHGTPLPRFPIQMEREIQVKLLQAEKVAERAAQHHKNQQRMRYFETLGNQVMALYGDDENPITWYKAVVDRVITRDELSGKPLNYPRFVVTFTEYGNTETVMLGEMDVLEGRWKDEKLHGGTTTDQGYDRHGGGGGGGRPPHDLYDEVRRRERETVTADKGWARRPASTKAMLAQPQKRSSSKHSVQDEDYDFRRAGPAANQSNPPPSSNQQQNQRQSPVPAAAAAPKRSAEELAAVAEKKRRLMAKYG